MFHSVSLIADVLINLQQHGNDQYMGWQMKFQCNTHNIVDELQNMASKMEKDLTEWKDEVKKMRGQFYQLNYFTTQQLLQLRKELGKFKDPNKHSNVRPQVMALLQCISRDITSDMVTRHLESIEQEDMQHEPASLSGPNIKVVEQKAISEDNEVVRELMLAGYDLKDSIEAVTACHGDIEQAVHYLMSRASRESQDGESQGDAQQSLDLLSEPMDIVEPHYGGQESVDFNDAVR